MANRIVHKRSSVTGKVPTVGDLEYGELAVNTADLKVYLKDSANTVRSLTDWENIHNKPAGLASAATANTANTLVLRDGSGNFSAGSITASLLGNATTATALETARTIAGKTFNGTQDVTLSTLTRGTYLTGSNYNGSANQTWAVDATSANTASKVVARDASGNFSAGMITADLTGAVTGNASSASKWTTPRNITLTGDSTGTVNIDGTADVSFATTLATTGVTAGTYTKVTVDAKGRVTVGSTLAASDIPNLDAAKIASGTLANARTTGTSASTANTLVLRDTSGNFSANTITANLSGNVTGSVTGNVSGNAGTATALQTARTIAGQTFDGTQDVILSTLTRGTYLTGSNYNGANATTWAVDATSANTASKVVARDASGNFSAGTITANLTGAVTGSASNNVLKAGDTMTGFLTLHANPTAALHAVTKQYVDNLEQGLKAKPAAKAATTTNLVGTYNNGTAGTGATLNLGTAATLTIGGVSAWALNDGVLVKDQTNAAHNGRYYVSQVGSASVAWILTRCGLCDNANEIPGAYTFITDGTYKGTGWVQTVANSATFVVGTDAITVAQFTGAGDYTAGNGITVNGTEISITPTGVSAGTYPKVTVDTTGRVTAGASLVAADIPNLDAAKITTGTLANARTSGVSTNTANTLVLRDGSGNFSAGTITANLTGAVTGNASTATTLATTRTIWGQNFNGGANVTGNLTSVGNITGSGAITIAAGGTDQSITITPSGTGTVNAPTFNATSTTGGGFQGIAADTAAAPSFTWTGDLDTGIFQPGADIIGFTAGGAERGRINTTGFSGNGSQLSSLNASNLASGTVADARLSGTYSGITLKVDGSNTVYTTPSPGSSDISARTVYGLAEYRSVSSAQVGAIVFIAPNTTSTVMHQLEVAGLLYNQNIVSMQVQGYRTTGAWSDLRKVSTGTVDVQTRWGVTPDGKNCLILGDVGTSWSYPHLSIVRAMFSHNVNDAYCTGWTTAVVTDLSAYTNVSANISDSAMVGSVTGNAATATALQTARTINGTSFNGSANITTANWGTARTLTIGATGKSVDGSGNVSWSVDEVLPTRLRGVAQTVTDWNTAIENGWYMASGATNAPAAGWWLGSVEAHNASWVTQTVHAFTGDSAADGQIWRRQLNSGTWGSWYRLRWSEAEQDARYAQVNGTGATGTWGINITGSSASTTGNAATATALQTARTINGVSFNGTANITVADSTKLPLSGGTMTGTIINSATSLILGNADGVTRGLLYNDAAGFGFLNSSSTWALRVNQGTSNVSAFGDFTASGNVTAYSDERLKKDIELIPNALAKVCELRGVTYTRIDTGERQTGVVAQDVQKVLPEAVKDGEHLSVAYGNMVGLLIEAIKEQQKQIDELRAQINK